MKFSEIRFQFWKRKFQNTCKFLTAIDITRIEAIKTFRYSDAVFNNVTLKNNIFGYLRAIKIADVGDLWDDLFHLGVNRAFLELDLAPLTVLKLLAEACYFSVQLLAFQPDRFDLVDQWFWPR